ncbi:glycerophosphodiester phosphodiesterase [Catenuloplanes indicus]|uniref:Glycerophosphoryl diester phosphodiesterase n=1 Tax=Catenuloplanes indicus TaxID=137267 RepID=A0AAE3W4N4_9ACTN|nr:glycerophosphodiester phosphodiesterase family protein [Catenuloplanes indicus]MDQ0369215.1 glycerophosphoryl diester phosphodiesterase [Catenuloplanes indicus]
MQNRPLIIAHRGYSAVAPENTIAALVAGVRAGADLLEIDVHVAADGVPVVIHDYTLERTTDGGGRVAEHTSAQLAALDAGSWRAPEFRGEPVPVLSQVLDLVAKERTGLLLEVKPFQTRAQTAAVIAEITARDLAPRVLLQSFDENVLRDARDLAPATLRLGLLRESLDADPVAAARALGCVAYNPGVDALLTAPAVATTLLAAGLRVMVWTTDDETQWRALTELGVTGIITNVPAELHAWQSAG